MEIHLKVEPVVGLFAHTIVKQSLSDLLTAYSVWLAVSSPSFSREGISLMQGTHHDAQRSI